MDRTLIDDAARELGVTLGQSLRQGGQKFVSRATRASNEVVIKIAEIVGPHSQIALERARREVALLVDIDHPHVVRVESDLVEIGDPVVRAVAWLEEFLDGGDLEDQLGVQWPIRQSRESGR